MTETKTVGELETEMIAARSKLSDAKLALVAAERELKGAVWCERNAAAAFKAGVAALLPKRPRKPAVAKAEAAPPPEIDEFLLGDISPKGAPMVQDAPGERWIDDDGE